MKTGVVKQELKKSNKPTTDKTNSPQSWSHTGCSDQVSATVTEYMFIQEVRTSERSYTPTVKRGKTSKQRLLYIFTTGASSVSRAAAVTLVKHTTPNKYTSIQTTRAEARLSDSETQSFPNVRKKFYFYISELVHKRRSSLLTAASYTRWQRSIMCGVKADITCWSTHSNCIYIHRNVLWDSSIYLMNWCLETHILLTTNMSLTAGTGRYEQDTEPRKHLSPCTGRV